MTIPDSLSGSIATIAASHAPGGTSISTSDGNQPEPDDYATVIRWIPLVVPLLALMPALGAYIILWSVHLTNT